MAAASPAAPPSPPLLVSDIRTPALLVDRSKLEANCRRMLDAARSRGLALRPHVKTHKTLEAALCQLLGSVRAPPPAAAAELRVVASTLGEARFYVAHGFGDVLYGVPFAAAKLGACAALAARAPLFSVLVDSMEAVRALEAGADGRRWGVFVDVDPGYHREGVDPHSPAALALVRHVLASPHLLLRGIYCHAGHAYLSKNAVELAKAAEAERDVISDFADRIRTELGYEGALIVSMGSTPTCSHLPTDMRRVTEVHPGNYVFYDRMQASLGACAPADCAATVLATVLGHYRHTRRILIDAGALALSKDQGCTHLDTCKGWGAVLGHEHIPFVSITQELGVLLAEHDDAFERLPVGSRLRLVPNHSCLTAACFEEYYVLDHADATHVADVWRTVPRQW